jgi:hypothetical protein
MTKGRKWTKNEIDAAWSRVADRYNSEFERQQKVKQIEGERLAREEFEARRYELGWRPPIKDRSGEATEEIQRLERQVEYLAGAISAQMLPPEFLVQSNRELIDMLIIHARELGALVNNSVIRQKLDRSTAAADYSESTRTMERERASAQWKQVKVVWQEIVDENECHGVTMEKGELDSEIRDRCKKRKIPCPPSMLSRKRSQWEKVTKSI